MASISLQLLRGLHITSAALWPPYHCSCFVASISLQLLRGLHITAAALWPPYHCSCFMASISLQLLCGLHITAAASWPPSTASWPSNHYSCFGMPGMWKVQSSHFGACTIRNAVQISEVSDNRRPTVYGKGSPSLALFILTYQSNRVVCFKLFCLQLIRVMFQGKQDVENDHQLK